MSNNSKFPTEVAKILIEERRKSMRDRVKVGDVVKVHVQVQSSAENHKVDMVKEKHQACDLYLLPPNLYPSDPLDTLDQCFLNYDHPPIQKSSSSATTYRISLFPPTIVQSTLQDQPEQHLDIEAIAPHLSTPLSPPSTPPPSASTPNSSTSTLDPSISPSLHESILASHDKLFFIKYTPTGAVRERWYLIQIDMVSTEDANLDPIRTQNYWCVFLAKHINDEKISDELARWWPLWYEYTTGNDGIITYGKRILFQPDQLPSEERYVQWAESFHLPSIQLLGPFYFLPINSSKNLVPLSIWRSFKDNTSNHQLLDLKINPKFLSTNQGEKSANLLLHEFSILCLNLTPRW